MGEKLMTKVIISKILTDFTVDLNNYWKASL